MTPYDAMGVSVRGHAGKKCAAATVSLAYVVGEQVRLAQDQGLCTLTRGTNKIPMMVCRDHTPLWRAAASHCEVIVGVWPGGPASAGNQPLFRGCIANTGGCMGIVPNMPRGPNGLEKGSPPHLIMNPLSRF